RPCGFIQCELGFRAAGPCGHEAPWAFPRLADIRMAIFSTHAASHPSWSSGIQNSTGNFPAHVLFEEFGDGMAVTFQQAAVRQFPFLWGRLLGMAGCRLAARLEMQPALRQGCARDTCAVPALRSAPHPPTGWRRADQYRFYHLYGGEERPRHQHCPNSLPPACCRHGALSPCKWIEQISFRTNPKASSRQPAAGIE